MLPGWVSSLAGSGEQGFKDGLSNEACFFCPAGVAVDPSGNILVADQYNHRIRIINERGEVSTFAGTGDSDGAVQGSVSRATFYYPQGVAVAEDKTVYVADTFNHSIRKIDAQGEVSTLAGTFKGAFKDGSSSQACFNYPWGLALVKDGSVIVADTHNHRIRRVSPQGHTTTLAGSGKKGNKDGPATEAAFNCPQAVAVGPNGHLMATDGNGRLCNISPQGVVSTVATKFKNPCGLLVDCRGNAIVADSDNHRIVFCTPHVLTVIAGDGEKAFKDGLGGEASFSHPRGLALDLEGRVLVADRGNHRVRAISLTSAWRLQHELTSVADSLLRMGGVVYRSARSLFAWTAEFTLQANETSPYGSGPFQLSVEMPFDYPSGAPLVKLLSPLDTGLAQVDKTTGEVKCMVWDEAKSSIAEALYTVKGLLVHSTPLPADTVFFHVQKEGQALALQEGRALSLHEKGESKNENAPINRDLSPVLCPIADLPVDTLVPGTEKSSDVVEATKTPPMCELPVTPATASPDKVASPPAIAPPPDVPAAVTPPPVGLNQIAEEPQGPAIEEPQAGAPQRSLVEQPASEEKPVAPATPRDGSVEFWRQKLAGVLDPDDLDEVASKLSVAGFKQRHLGKLSQDMLNKAGLNQGNILDIMDHQHSLAGFV